MCGGLSHSKCATAFIVIVFEEMIFQSKNPLVHFSSYLRSASLSNKSFFFFRRYGILRSFVVVILHSKNNQSVPLPVFVQLYYQTQ